MTPVQGLGRAAIALLLTASGSTFARAADSLACPEFTQPKNWYLSQIMIDHAAKHGPPEIAQAAAALRGGKRHKAVLLLTTAGRIPIEVAVRHGRAYSSAVLDAQEAAWQLNGCQ